MSHVKQRTDPVEHARNMRKATAIMRRRERQGYCDCLRCSAERRGEVIPKNGWRPT